MDSVFKTCPNLDRFLSASLAPALASHNNDLNSLFSCFRCLPSTLQPEQSCIDINRALSLRDFDGFLFLESTNTTVLTRLRPSSLLPFSLLPFPPCTGLPALPSFHQAGSCYRVFAHPFSSVALFSRLSAWQSHSRSSNLNSQIMPVGPVIALFTRQPSPDTSDPLLLFPYFILTHHLLTYSVVYLCVLL